MFSVDDIYNCIRIYNWSIPFRFRSWNCKSHVYYPCIVIFSSLCCHVYDLTQPTLKMIMLCSWYLQAPLHDALRVMPNGNWSNHMRNGVAVILHSRVGMLNYWSSIPPPPPPLYVKFARFFFFGNYIILFKREENSNVQCVDLNHS